MAKDTEYYKILDKKRMQAREEDGGRTFGRVPVGVSSEVEGAPKAGMTVMSVSDAEPAAPRAMVRGVPDEMSAEYYAPAEKARSRAPNQAAARAAVERLKEVGDESANIQDDRRFAAAMGAGLGAAIGAGLGGPAAPFTGALGVLAGGNAGNIAFSPSYEKEYDMRQAQRAARRAIEEGLQSGAFTREELAEALAARGLKLR